jgi:hypothetical protein
MTTTTRHLMTTLMMATLMAEARPVLAGSSHDPRTSGVRSTSASITALIGQAAERSETFRRMVETINASDGIVYVEAGDCGHGVRACLTAVTEAGPNRVLRVVVDMRKKESDLMASIGHELRHTIEVLSSTRVRNNRQLYFFYAREGRVSNRAFETAAAIVAGEHVREEIRKYVRR